VQLENGRIHEPLPVIIEPIKNITELKAYRRPKLIHGGN
jgi:hypothetical protein